jgi:drug/metabolite transporter (DMT)-like permease
MLFIPITAAAAAFQVARNALQRGLVGDAGPWGATLVRFLFGLPFSLVFLAVAWALAPQVRPDFTAVFWIAAALGALAQIAATGALLSAMHRSGFALGAAFQQSSLPLAAVAGLAIGESPSALGWFGLALTTAGLLALSWPRRIEGRQDWAGAVFGLISGACYAVALNAYRVAGLQVVPHHPVVAALFTTSTTQALQTVALGGWLAIRSRRSLVAVIAAWRSSLGAGFFGAAASALWLTALALAPAAPVRAVGVIEMPLSAIAGRRMFAERLTLRQLVLGAVVTVGVVLATLG